MSHLRKTVLGRNVKRFGLGLGEQNWNPVKWSHYFDNEGIVNVPDGAFHYYKKGDSGPVIVCLHGGGYSGLTWALFAAEITNLVECQVVALDLRGHGNTQTNNDTDLSLETLAKDVYNVVNELFTNADSIPIILVGHSMGGAIAVEASYLISSTVALCVIDVVEGTALDALSSMQSILRGRPAYFQSVQQAIQWCYKSGQTHNLEAARVSMPGQIVNVRTGNLAANTSEIIQAQTSSTSPEKEIFRRPALPSSSIIPEEVEDKQNNDCGKPPLPKSSKISPSIVGDSIFDSKYTWRIDLSKTECFWSGWFKGLSQKFLDKQLPKLLMLANIHGLDTALTVGQMQGKFQLQVLNKSGHAIHEDQPSSVAEILGGYLLKQNFVTAKCPLTSLMPGC